MTDGIVWKHVRSMDNSADVISRENVVGFFIALGCLVGRAHLASNGFMLLTLRRVILGRGRHPRGKVAYGQFLRPYIPHMALIRSGIRSTKTHLRRVEIIV